jgi:hypothetical protein
VRSAAGGQGRGVGETKGGCSRGVGATGRAERPASQSRRQVGREEAAPARAEPGEEGAQPAVTAAENQEAGRARFDPRTPGWRGAE